MSTAFDPWEDDQFCWEASLGVDAQADAQEAVGQSRMNPTAIHEWIKRGQACRAAECADQRPTETDEVYWLYATAPKRHRYPAPTDHSGKWLIFCKPENIDDTWREVKRAVEKGQLGRTAKCSTLMGFKGEDYVICVYTYDWKDSDDALAIRQTLRDVVGVDKPIPYKSDADTLAGRYASDKRTQGKIAKYYE